MKNLILLFALMFATNTFAFEGLNSGTALGLYNRIDCTDGVTCSKGINGIFTMNAATQAEGINSNALAIFDYDFAVDGGAIGTIATGVDLPAKAVIEQCWFRVETQLVDAGAGTLAVTCEDANNIFSAADFTGNAAGSFVAGAPLGTVATMVDDIAASCDISFVIATSALTAGKIRGYCRYTVHE